MRLMLKMVLTSLVAGVLAFGFVGVASAQVGDMPGMGGANDATGGGLEGPAVNELGNTEHGECVKDLLDLPALEACEDAEGRVIMDLPGLKLVGPAAEKEQPAPPKRELPKTGMETGDFAALGLATLAGGAILLRRMRLAVA